MADRLPPGQGALQNWNNINLNKPEEYSSEFVIDGNRYANVTNVSTGQRQLYFVQPVSGARGLLTTTNADGTISKGGNYDNFNQFNPGKLAAAEAANKQASVRLLSTPGISTPAEATAIKNSSQFKSTTAGSNVATGGVTPGSTPVDLGVKGTGKKSNFGDHRYPLDIDKIKQDKIKFSMLEYKPRGFSSFKEGSSEDLGMLKDREGTDKRIIGTVYLPVPSGISEVNSAGWDGTPATPFQLLAQNIALTTVQQGISAGADVVGGVAKAAVSPSNNPDIGNAVAAGIAEAATNSGGLLSRTQGAIINPNLELLFNAPTLRPFNFTFKMSARSDKEAEEIIKIIRFFKQGMSPQKSESNLFIKAPHTFKIQYLLGSTNKDHPFIGQIKECALQNFVVNYTPEGQYATFYDGVLVSYEIQMTFSELEPVFNEDYGENFVNNLLFKE
jgi:hypothetical protein